MTTGEPVVVRAAMKPLPTLTKPLRSVDIATHEPAEALRERTDSATIPAAGVVGEAMVAFVLAGAYREKFGGDHVDDVLEAVGAVRGADRVAAALKPALVFIGFMGAGKSRAAREAAAALGVARRRRRRAARGQARRADRRRSSRATARPRSAPPRRSWPARCSRRADGGVIALGGGALRSERVRAALRPPRRRARSTSTSTRRGRARAASGRPLARERDAFARALPRARAGLRGGRRRGAAGDRRRASWRARSTRCARSPRATACCGRRAPRATTRCGSAPLRRARRGRRPGGGSSSATRPSPRCTAGASPTPPGLIEIPAGRGAQDAGDGRAHLARARRAGRHPRRPRRRRSAAASSATSRASARRPTSAASPSSRCRRRSSPRSTRPTAARPGSTCPRPRTTSAPTTSRSRCSPIRTLLATLPPAELAAGYAEVVKTALIAGGALWDRVAAGAPDRRRRDRRAACAPSCASWPPTSATAARARRSTSATRSATRSRPRPATRATATARRSASGCSPRCGCPGQDALRAARRGLLARGRPADARWTASTPPRWPRRPRATRSARARPCPSCWSHAPGRVATGHAVGARRAARRRARVVGPMSVRNRVEVMHGVNLDQLGRRPAAVYGELTYDRLAAADRRASRASSASRCASSRPTPRRVRRAPAPPRRACRTRIVMNPGAWTHYAWAIRDALEIAALPTVEVHLSDVGQPRGVAARVRRARPVRGDGERPGDRRIPSGARAPEGGA